MKNIFLTQSSIKLLSRTLNCIIILIVFALPLKGSNISAPVNDACSNAVALTIDATATSGTLASATTTSGISTYSSLNDVWYSFTSTCNTHTVLLSYSSGSDIYYEVYQSSTCPMSGAVRTANAAGSTTNNVQLTSLTIGVNYFIRVIDHKPNATTFTIAVTSSPTTPALTSSSATNITITSATLNGSITTLPCPTISKGFVYSLTTTNSNPLNNGSGVTNSSISGLSTGAYTLALTGLTSGVGYSYKAYVFDGTTYTYGSVQTFTTFSNNADLSTLLISSGTILPTFASTTISYTATVTNSTSSVTITPTKSNSSATIQAQVNGGGYSTVTSGSASGSLSLNVGSNTIDIKVTAQDGTIKTYTITVCRAVTPSVSIAITSGAQTICSGTSVTFTPTPTNGGLPTYQWQKGGVNINGATGTTYNSTSLANNDAITVIMTSNATCVSPTTATSNTITMTVNALPTASSPTKVDDLCQVGAGTITVSVSGGTPSYTIAACGTTISPSPTVGQFITLSNRTISTNGGTTTFSSLSGNITYKFTITDANGCVAQ